MSNPVWGVVMAVAGVALIAVSTLGLKDGTFRDRGSRITRTGQPIAFWSAIAIYLGCGLFLLVMGFRMATGA